MRITKDLAGMFLSNLQPDQQAVFLHLAQSLVAADARVDVAESSRLEGFISEIGTVVTPRACTMSEVATIFNTRRARVSAFLELLALAHIDGDYHASEAAFITNLAAAFSIPPEDVDDMTSWVVRQLHLLREAETFLED
ncbi:hypothetical protein [Rhodovastum atsumiense]|nr:hypothetical protein [Rhodovastum atsumiense]